MPQAVSTGDRKEKMKQAIQTAILLMWLLACSYASGPEIKPMPEYSNIPYHFYHTYMAPQGCSPIKDFYYDSPFVFTPPYLVTEDFTEGEQTLIMACESNNPNDEYPYRILVFTRNYKLDPFAKYEEYSACPSQIPLEYKTGGLSVVKMPESSAPMDSTFYRAVDRTSTDKIIITDQATLISTERSGGWTDFLCFEGRWYYRVIH